MEITFLKEKIEKLNEWTKAYDEGHPMVSDEEYDKEYFELEAYEEKYGIYLPESPTQRISYKVVNQLEKVTHNHPMLSLAKTKDWTEFIRYFSDIASDKDVIGMLKLDGLTCSLRYLDGKLVSAETRGNGEIGEDILHNALVIKSIPNRISYPNKIPYKDELIIDGEVICTYKDFEQFSDKYKNPRNFASGSIRLLDSKECAARNLTFVVWNVVKGFEDINSFSEKLQCVKKLGFEVTPWTSSLEWGAEDFLRDEAKELGYPIDGLVGRFDDIAFGTSLGATAHHTRAAYAFKFYDETYSTHLKNIEWSAGKTGIFTPVAIFDSVEIDGTTVERCSLHNVSVMKDLLGTPFLGQSIEIYKANLIIPQIQKAEKREIKENEIIFNIPTHCPICNSEDFGIELITKDSDTQVVRCNNLNCSGKILNMFDHFCGKKGLDIKGLSKATLEKLLDWGFIEDFTDLFALQPLKKSWCEKPGFGEKSVQKILNAIEEAKHCTLDKYICAFGIPNIGVSASKQLAAHFKTLDNFLAAVDNKFDFTQLEDFGEVMHNSLVNYNYIFMREVSVFMQIEETESKEKITNNIFSDKTFVVTGKLTTFKNRAELTKKIEELGGKVAASISKNTNYLINNDINSVSAKNKKAKELSIPIITEEDFLNIINKEG